jgi:hypothetical protein
VLDAALVINGPESTFVVGEANGRLEPSLPAFCTAANVRSGALFICNATVRESPKNKVVDILQKSGAHWNG